MPLRHASGDLFADRSDQHLHNDWGTTAGGGQGQVLDF